MFSRSKKILYYSHSKGNYTPGVKQIFIDGRSVEVYCDNDGWTVFQSRGQIGFTIQYFYRRWSEYKNGFGVPG